MSKAKRSQPRANWGDDDSGTPILHVDMDSFFASVEVQENPRLRGKPVIVGGLSNRGVVTAATYEARAFGVHSGQPLSQARRCCPEGVFLPVRMSLYKEYSHKIMAVLQEITLVVEQISVDEAFLDVGGARLRLGSPLKIAELIRTQIRTELGLPASVGIACNKSVAKIASAHAKPDGILLIPAEQTVNFLHSLPIENLWGVGGKTTQILFAYGIETIRDLAEQDVRSLEKILGLAAAHNLHNLAWGIDNRKVGETSVEKSISVERTFTHNLTSRIQVEDFLYWASEKCAIRLRRQNLVAWTVHVKLRDAKFQTISRSTTLSVPSDLTKQIAESALEMFAKIQIPPGGYRLAGVGVSNLSGLNEGIPLTLDDDSRDLLAEKAVDAIRERFGDSAVQRARLLKQ